MPINFPKSLPLVIIGLILLVKMPLELVHAMVWTVQHIYMILEFLLDELIGHFFEASRRTTQITVFYLMLGLGFLSAYWLMQYFRKWWSWFTITLPEWYAEQKRQIVRSWLSSSLLKRVQVISGVSMGGSVLMLLAF